MKVKAVCLYSIYKKITDKTTPLYRLDLEDAIEESELFDKGMVDSVSLSDLLITLIKKNDMYLNMKVIYEDDSVSSDIIALSIGTKSDGKNILFHENLKVISRSYL